MLKARELNYERNRIIASHGIYRSTLALIFDKILNSDSVVNISVTTQGFRLLIHQNARSNHELNQILTNMLGLLNNYIQTIQELQNTHNDYVQGMRDADTQQNQINQESRNLQGTLSRAASNIGNFLVEIYYVDKKLKRQH